MNAKKLKQLVDDLGQIKAEMAILKNDEAAMRAKLLAEDVTVAEGYLFRANVVDANRTTIDWKAIAAKLNPSRQLVKAHTGQSVVTSVRITSRIGVTA